MLRPVSLVLAVTLGAVAVAFAGRSVLAQTPPTTATPAADATNTPANPSPTPAYAPGPLTINATIRLAVSPEGLYQVIPEGTTVQVTTSAGTCVEVALSAADVQALNATKQLGGLTIEVPERGSAAAGAASNNCPAPGEVFGIALAFPSGSYMPLSTGPYSGGAVSVEFVVPAPGRIADGAQLPNTGAGATSASGSAYLALALLLAALGALGASRVVARRTHEPHGWPGRGGIAAWRRQRQRR